MPSFAHFWGLLALVAVPPLLWLWRRGRATLRFSDLRPARALPAGRVRWAIRGGLALRGLGLTLLIVAACGPRWPDPRARVETEGIAIAMVVDVSSSMADADFLWEDAPVRRLDGVKKVFRRFVEGGSDGPAPRPQDHIALVVFATHPETACPLTHDHVTLLRILDDQEPRTVIGERSTNAGDGIAWALLSLQKALTRRKVIVFLTDGESNVPPPALTPRQAAQLAGNLHIPIHAINAGPEEDVGDAKKAEKSLQEVAAISGGKYFRAADAEALLEACKEIDRLERDRIKTFEYRRYHEGYVWIALAALTCWLAVMVLEATVWRRLP
jgi:Ca-activated chloride channel family protein